MKIANFVQNPDCISGLTLDGLNFPAHGLNFPAHPIYNYLPRPIKCYFRGLFIRIIFIKKPSFY